MVTLADVQAAAERIRPHVVRTPLERSIQLSERCGTDVWLKLECFQSTGSFKIRGALNALSARPGVTQVVTASAGNHGLGVARAAALLRLSAIVVVPETASQAKVVALKNSGAELIQHGQVYDAAEAEGLRISRERDIPFISPYNDPDVIAGGGTVALEVFDALPETRTLLVPVGGGGLISGISIATHGLRDDAVVYGAQSDASPTLHEALAHGKVVSVDIKPSLADGLAGNLDKDTITFDLIRTHVREILLVSEDEILEAMQWLLLNERVVVEGAAAVGVAALLHRHVQPVGPVVVVLSGRNVATSVLQQYVHGPLRVPQV
jgi:threonine dehydratase